MPLESVVLGSLSALLLGGVPLLQRRDRSPTAYWIGGWISAAIGGLLLLLSPGRPALGLLTFPFSTLFPWFLLAGALALGDRRVPRWLFLLGVTFMAVLTAPVCGGGNPADLNLPFEDITFPSAEFDRPTPAYFIPADTPNGGTIIALPTGSASRGDRLYEIEVYHRAGFDVLTYSSRTCVGGAAGSLGERVRQAAPAEGCFVARPDRALLSAGWKPCRLRRRMTGLGLPQRLDQPQHVRHEVGIGTQRHGGAICQRLQRRRQLRRRRHRRSLHEHGDHAHVPGEGGFDLDPHHVPGIVKPPPAVGA